MNYLQQLIIKTATFTPTSVRPSAYKPISLTSLPQAPKQNTQPAVKPFKAPTTAPSQSNVSAPQSTIQRAPMPPASRSMNTLPSPPQARFASKPNEQSQWSTYQRKQPITPSPSMPRVGQPARYGGDRMIASALPPRNQMPPNYIAQQAQQRDADRVQAIRDRMQQEALMNSPRYIANQYRQTHPNNGYGILPRRF